MLTLLNPIKDKVISTALKKVFNSKFARIGEILNVDFNSSSKSLSARLALKGEEKPLDIYLENYRILEDGGRCLLSVDKVRTSKEWLNQLFSIHLKKQKLELPGHLAPIIRMIA
ncbi:MAG: hypothetical protein JXK94_15095 [Deltaproteobacteria bacterium]|nr:hypothetical protein [Deltaproteobacteria bacterium]